MRLPLLLGFWLSFCLLGGAAASAAWADTADGNSSAAVATAQGKKGWNSNKTKYYVDGIAVTGAKKIGGKWRAFNAKGKLMKKAFKLAGVTYYASTKGVLEARKAKGSYYYANGKKMTKTDAYEYKTIEKARSIAKKITKRSWSKQKKLRACFNWVRAKNYAFHRGWTGSKTWPAIYAMDHFNNKNGDCHSDAAAFAYLAYAVGYTNVYCCTDSGKTREDNHAWCQLNGKVYDPLFDQSKPGSYFGRSYRNFVTSAPSTKVKIPYYSPKHASKKAAKLSDKNGLVKSGSSYYFYKNGKKVKGAWKTVKSKRYYFKSNGKAATYAYKVKGTYYVFNTKGQLQKGSSVRLVSIGSKTYRVSKGGKAVKGWNSTRTQRFAKTGQLMCGVWYVGGKLYAAAGNGIYDASKTATLNASATVNTAVPIDAKPLIELLGTPKSSVYMGSCNTVYGKPGDDGLLKYSHIIVTTFRDASGSEWLMGIDAA